MISSESMSSYVQLYQHVWHHFYHTLAPSGLYGHGEITHVELLNGMMKLSNGVRAIDSVLLQRDMGRLLKAAELGADYGTSAVGD